MRTPSLLRVAALTAAVTAAPVPTAAQYFGRTKVQYENFRFRILNTPHFDIHFYPEEEPVTRDAGRIAERWYARLSATLGHNFSKKPLIFYADQPDFQQTNVVGQQLTEETGGVTEASRDRVILPFTGSYAENDHVIGHELVHVFQYDMANRTKNGIGGLETLPLWLVEGMAEYFSLGRADPNTALWLRDAALRNKLPTIQQLTTDPRFFPYRYGQALWAYVGGRWGDSAVASVYRASLSSGFETAIRRVLGRSTDSLSKEWIAQIKADYLPLTTGRTLPAQVGRRVVGQPRRGGTLNVSPVLSPDGRLIAFFSSRNLFGVSLYVADAQTGHIVRELSAPTTSAHLDAISYVYTAGTWSPDGRRIATIAYAQGDHEIVIVDARRGNIERRIHLDQVPAILGVAWSPDGTHMAISGGRGGVSDLYVYDLASGRLDQLTNDRYSDMHPAWSPDGRTIAFSTDRGQGTSFEELRYTKPRLATIDVASHEVRVIPIFNDAKHINPQFSADGASLFFVSDQDGFDDVYRYTVSGGQTTRVTRVATGVSGITATSPAISVARQTGRLMMSVFDAQGYSIHAIEPADLTGTPVAAPGAGDAGNAVPTPTTPSSGATAGLLPPLSAGNTGIVASYLANPTSGLPPTSTQYAVTPYHTRIMLEEIAQPSVGVSSGGLGGTQFVGGVGALFSDMLENNLLQTAFQVSGTRKDIGGQLFYLNQRHRWNLFTGAAHVPYLTGFAFVEDVAVPVTGGGTIPGQRLTQVLQRTYVDQATLGTQYPFSTTRRAELSVTGNRYSYNNEIQRVTFVGVQQISEESFDTTAPPSVSFGQATAALVGDNAFFGFTSPIQGSRWRFEGTPTFGQIKYFGALADYRRYFYLRPVTLAARGIHFGRYGTGGEDTRLSPLYVGDPSLVRGYDVNDVELSECANATTIAQCPQLDRLVGSRVAVANLELRIPFAGPRGLALLPIGIPIELAPFADAGVAWTRTESPSIRFVRNTTARVPVTSVGVSARINVFGFAVAELFEAYPFQRPGAGWQFGFQLLPGW